MLASRASCAAARSGRKRGARIVVVGDGVVPTGYARVVNSIFARLHDSFDVHQLACNYSGETRTQPWPIDAIGPAGDARSAALVGDSIARLAPDVVFMINDIWVINRYLAEIPDDVPVIAYCPVDSGPIAPSAVAHFARARRIVACTHYGRNQIRQAMPSLDVDIIPHGVDTSCFHPLDRSRAVSRSMARRQLYPDVPEWQDAFIVLNANRNQPRKRIDTTIVGFAQFARNKPANVKLHLHMGVERVGWDVLELGRRYGIDDRMVVTTDTPHMPAMTEAQLNLVYNACDVGVNTSSGEGWGLVSFEHAATGAAQLVPRHSACEELWQDAALLLEPAMRIVEPSSLCELPLIEPRTVAAALERLHADSALCSDLGEAAYANALKSEYRWDAIADRWANLFSD